LKEQQYITFGDIHGCYHAAESAVQLSEDLGCQAIFLGDYVDRGPSSLNTLRILIDAKKNHSDWIFLRGNHDQMVLDLLNGNAELKDERIALDRYLYTYKDCSKTLAELNEISNLELKEITSFLNSTLLYYENEHFVFTHAVLRENYDLVSEKTEEELLWNYDYNPTWEGKPFIHGHLPCSKITFKEKGININTKCGYGGILTGLYIEEKNKTFVFSTYSISENGESIIQNQLTNKLYLTWQKKNFN